MEGAGFAFDTTNMDFSNVFTTMPQQQQQQQQQQQSFLKPSQGDTSADFFFGDEGIDTTASFIDPILFSTPSQEPSYMTQNLAMDNTMGSTSVWNAQLTPNSHCALNSFPPTPIQSFDVYQPSYGSTLGKRSLQADANDFPQAKRHASIGDYTSLSPFPSSAPSSLDVGVGLSDEAADVCATWFNKYAILPSDRHIDSLSHLTGEPATAIRHWFGQLLKQGMGNSNDSAYKSQTDLIQPDQFWSEQFTAELVQQPQLAIQQTPSELLLGEEAITTPELSFNNDATTSSQPASTLRGSKKRCTPTDDISLLNRDSNKVYQCTRKCGKRYGRKCDWKRNEEEGYPCKSWVCSLCISEGVDNVRPCFRKYHFVQHFRNIHPEISSEGYEESSIVCSETEFPRNCGFCKHRFDSRQERIDHIADHFKQGKCMLDWNDEESNGSHDSDNMDDDDDKPSGDDSDGNSSDQSPDSNPDNGSGSKHFGSGDYGGGGGGSGTGESPTQGGFFQFQLSELNGDTHAVTDLRRSLNLQRSQRFKQASSAAPELPDPNAPHDPNPTKQCSLYGSSSSTETSDKTALARDVLTEPLTKYEVAQPTARGGGKSPLIEHHFWKRAHITIDSTDATQLQVLPDSSKGAEYTHHSDSSVDAAARLRLLSVGLSSGTSQMPETLPELDLVECTVVSSRKTLSTDANSKQPGEPLPAATSALVSQPFLSVKLLGAGGFSTVDEVLHRETNLRVGRKTLKNRTSSAAEELRKEVNVLQKLRHPHIIRFLGAYSRDDKMSILISPVAETTLALWLEKSALQRPTGLTETMLKMFGCLVSSVRYLHEQRPVVIHMDIKPQNILITQGDQGSPHVVLSDFGTSSSDDSDDQRKPLTRRYIAPEVFDGFTRKQAADIWSLGCVFSEMAAVSFSQSNMRWLDFRQEYSGRAGKHYWQDLPGLQDRLSSFLQEASTNTERTVVHEIRTMLSPVPAERPNAASLSLKFVPAPCCLNWPNDQAIFPGPNEELNNAEMIARDDGVDCRTQHPHGTDTNRSQLGLLDNAKLWLEDCSHSHDACQQTASDTKALPTRLIDLRPDGTEGQTVRIVNGDSIRPSPSSVEYVALSHAWNQTQLTLTSERFAAMQEGLPRETLPKQLESAIQAAQHLGYRYMWLDSLCILQDSDEDKRYECANMATVYRNAALTIVLDQLDRQASSMSWHSSTGHTPPSQTTGDAPGSIDFTSSGFNWNTGAWVLQERLLSRRFLHIGPEQMYWECNALKASSTFPRGLPPLLWEKVHSKAPLSSPRRNDANANNAATSTLDTTPHLVNTHLRHCQWMKKHEDGVSNKICASTEVAAPATCGCVEKSFNLSSRRTNADQCQHAVNAQREISVPEEGISACCAKKRIANEKMD